MKRDMFISTKKYDEVNARNVELARQVRDLRYENAEHKDTFKEIISLTESNDYNNKEVIIRKIKELAETGIKS